MARDPYTGSQLCVQDRIGNCLFIRPQTGTLEANGVAGCQVIRPVEVCCQWLPVMGLNRVLLGSPSHRENIFVLKEPAYCGKGEGKRTESGPAGSGAPPCIGAYAMSFPRSHSQEGQSR